MINLKCLWFRFLLRYGAFESRTRAAKQLGKIDSEAALLALIGAIGDRHAHVRIAVAETLSDKRNPRACKPLLVALNDDVPRVRIAAVEALGWTQDRELIGSLILPLTDYDEIVQRKALASLERLDPHWEQAPSVKIAYRDLIQIACGNASERRKILAVQWIAKIWGPSTVPLLSGIAGVIDIAERQAVMEADEYRPHFDPRFPRLGFEAYEKIRRIPTREELTNKLGVFDVKGDANASVRSAAISSLPICAPNILPILEVLACGPESDAAIEKIGEMGGAANFCTAA